MSDNIKTEIKRINGYLKEITTFLDSSGRPISQVINPIMTELKPRDILQIFIGTMIFGAPLCYTEEVWNLSLNMSLLQTIQLNFFGSFLLSLFIYLNFYRYRLKGNIVNYLKRVLAVYAICFTTIGIYLSLLGKLPVGEIYICFNRITLIGIPSLFSAAISDMLK
ncbi:MAG: DUF2391 family protein [Bacteriovoracaceae bacterium]|jgi:uncharacterized membrane protein|nr:DUF2391 family protein [Bacteriovoracaceae bacterium]